MEKEEAEKKKEKRKKKKLLKMIKPKILLIVSPNYSMKILQEEIDNLKNEKVDFTKSVDWRISPPLGILYIAGELRKYNYDVEIYDLHRAFHLCRESRYFKEKKLSDFFKEYFDNILKKKFDVLGMSCLFNVASTSVEEIAIRCKKKNPNTKIILGGHYPTNNYEILEKKLCDYIILGEAEKQFVWLMDNLDNTKKIHENPHILSNPINKSKIPSIIENLDNLAFPAWDLLPYCEEYIKKSVHAERIGSSIDKTIRSAPILTTRGCPMKCTFCAAHGVHGRIIRTHSISYLIKYIDWLVDKYDINNLLIEDDMFNFSPERTIEFCETLYKKYKNRFTIEFPNGLFIYNLNKEVIKNLKKIGLKTITIAIESGNQYVQDNILKKYLNLSDVKRAVKLLQEHGIDVRTFFIVGFVGETLGMIQDTIRFAIDLNTEWSAIKIFTPLVGSEMYDIAKEKGYLIGDTSEHVYGRCCIKTPEFTPEQVEEIRYDANIRINFLNNKNLKEGKFDSAEKVFSKLLKVFPGHLFAQWGIWKALKGQGKEEANQALKKLGDMAKKDKKNCFLLEKYNIKL